MNLTEFGGSFAKISDPPLGNMVMVRGTFRLTEIQLGVVMGEQSWIIKRLTGYTISKHTNQDVDGCWAVSGSARGRANTFRVTTVALARFDFVTKYDIDIDLTKRGGAVAPPSLGRKRPRKQQSKTSYCEVTYTFRSSRTQSYSQQHRVNFSPERCSKE
jgi:hypothetical protein